MKVRYKVKIGDYTIVTHVADAAVDPERTKEKIAPMIKPEMNDDDIKRLFNENLVYANVGPEADLVSDETGSQVQDKLDEAGKHRRLLVSGEYIVDHRCCEYWIKKSGKWANEKIEEIGVELPEGAVLQEDFTPEQQEEIADWQETERIAGMSLEEKAAAKQSALDALADEADRLDRRSKIQEQAFDPIIWYKERARFIEAKYA